MSMTAKVGRTGADFIDYDNHVFELDTTDLDGDLGESAFSMITGK
jgi:hypothetical protein